MLQAMSSAVPWERSLPGQQLGDNELECLPGVAVAKSERSEVLASIVACETC